MDFLSSSMGFLIVIVLPMLLFFIYQVYNLIMIAIRLKKAVAVETARETAIAQEEAAQKAAAQRPEPSEAQNEAEAAKAALEEARKMREEAEAIRAKAEKELADARKQTRVFWKYCTPSRTAANNGSSASGSSGK